MPNTKPQALCKQIKPNGEICEAVRLTDDQYCYYHSRDRQRLMVIEKHHRGRVLRLNAGLPADETHKLNNHNNQVYNESQAMVLAALELPALDDANAIQITVTNIVRLLAFQQIDHKSAALILYGLQIVSGVLNKMQTKPLASRPQATTDPEPLAELAAMLADLRHRKKAAASAAAERSATKETKNESEEEETAEEIAPTGSES